MPFDYRTGPIRAPRTKDPHEREAVFDEMLVAIRHRTRFPLTYFMNSAGTSFPGLMVIPATGRMIKPNLRLIKMIGHYRSGAPGGNSTVLVADQSTAEPGTTLATLTLTQALATFTVVSADFNVEILPGKCIGVVIGTDNGHRGIVVSAWFSQVPRRA